MSFAKESVFWFPPESQAEADYFLNAFPAMPDKSKLTGSMDAITFMSDEAFIYYLPFLLECLEEDAMAYDRLLVIVEVKLDYMKPEAEEKYKTELTSARSRVAAINEKL